MPVIIKAETQGLLPFEKKARISNNKVPFNLENNKKSKQLLQPAKQIMKATKESVKGTDSQGFYIVKSGDTLIGIATKNKITVEKIIQINNLSNPDRLKVGQRLRIR